ncbi:hypothetical protein [Psychrobacter sp. P11G5]|uniref:hypothetical protein n=1 Tax=Psychrobacter sp. P11G5 TaxID=1699624 RepID=UPI000AB44D04|nr:hypothetical protein [Psychrobacter sp. P11G5]
MLNTSQLIATVSAYKRHTRTILSVMILLTLSPLVQAAGNNHADDSLNKDFVIPISYCYNGNATQNVRPKHKMVEQQTIDCMLTELALYQKNSLTSRQQYFAYKAQAWLNYASHENSIKSNTQAGSQALKAGAHILQKLRSNADEELKLTTDIPSSSALMRPDLWATVSALKDSASKDSTSTDSNSIIIAPRELAFSEVALIWAAADQCAHGWRQSGTHFRMAERWLEQAREAYVNAHDSKTNVALESSIVDYYKQYAPLDPHDDVCHGQSLPPMTQVADSKSDNSVLLVHSTTIPMPIPTVTYRIGYKTINHLIN